MRTPGIMPDYSLAAVAVVVCFSFFLFPSYGRPKLSCGFFPPSLVGDENRFLRILGRWQPHHSSFEILEIAERSSVANDGGCGCGCGRESVYKQMWQYRTRRRPSMVSVFWTFPWFPRYHYPSRIPSGDKGTDGRLMWAFQPPFLSHHYRFSFKFILWTMTAVIPMHLVLLHKARRLCIILSCMYLLLVALGATPFAQAQ